MDERVFLRSLEINSSKTKSQTMNVQPAKRAPFPSVNWYPRSTFCPQSRWREKGHESRLNTRETARNAEEFDPLRR